MANKRPGMSGSTNHQHELSFDKAHARDLHDRSNHDFDFFCQPHFPLSTTGRTQEEMAQHHRWDGSRCWRLIIGSRHLLRNGKEIYNFLFASRPHARSQNHAGHFLMKKEHAECRNSSRSITNVPAKCSDEMLTVALKTSSKSGRGSRFATTVPGTKSACNNNGTGRA